MGCKKRNRQNEERGEIQVKSIIAKVVIACGGLIAVFGGMGLNSEGDAGFILAFKITAVGLTIAGAGIILNKLKERDTLRKYTRSH